VKKLTDEKEMLRYFAMGYEVLLDTIMEACSKQRSIDTGSVAKVSQTCNILDLKGFKITHAPKAYDFAKPASEMGQLYYPEILGEYISIDSACSSSMPRCCSLECGPW